MLASFHGPDNPSERGFFVGGLYPVGCLPRPRLTDFSSSEKSSSSSSDSEDGSDGETLEEAAVVVGALEGSGEGEIGNLASSISL